MSKQRLDQLRGKCPIFYRSTQDLHGGKANIWFTDTDGRSAMSIQFLTDGQNDKPLSLLADDIIFIKTKEYTDKSGTQLWVLALGVHENHGTHTAEALEQTIFQATQAVSDLVQHTFQFSEPDIKNKTEAKSARDNWEHCLRTLRVELEMANETEVKVVASKFRPIEKIELQQPQAGKVVSIKITLETSAEPVTLDIGEAETGSDACKRLTNQFIDDHSVLPTENTSLYRYIRSVVQRALMEKETKVIIDEINRLKFETLLKSPKYADLDKTLSANISKIVNEGAHELQRISASIPTRIGQHGSGATVVNTVLKRNVEKLKLINELAAKKCLHEQAGAG